MGRIWKMSLLISALIIIDQLTKGYVQSNFSHGESTTIIEGFFNFTYVRNPGAAFGMGAGASELMRKVLFLFVPVLACFFLGKLIWDHRNKHFVSCLTYSLILAGAIGNLIDRFTLGYVVDFFDFYINTSHFPAFNVADSAISIGGILLVYEFFFIKEENEGSEGYETN